MDLSLMGSLFAQVYVKISTNASNSKILKVLVMLLNLRNAEQKKQKDLPVWRDRVRR